MGDKLYEMSFTRTVVGLSFVMSHRIFTSHIYVTFFASNSADTLVIVYCKTQDLVRGNSIDQVFLHSGVMSSGNGLNFA